MIRVTADANIYISSLVFGGVPDRLIRAAEDGLCLLAVSDALIVEIRRVLLTILTQAEFPSKTRLLRLHLGHRLDLDKT